jgi:hypothetical protein
MFPSEQKYILARVDCQGPIAFFFLLFSFCCDSFFLRAQHDVVKTVILILGLKNQIILEIGFYCNRHFQNLKLQLL